ncbi:MAG: type II secretion system protein GspL [Hydrogenophaga sp.]|uniref:type II secretion system protein GspL n=1 Tax=Hydrogenophaga sp. TaxID=1904254 RepID=UPI002730B3A9|nr:type II secretion system protein GspL [Hydrogenophaga sp.]MDP2162668.1 type II secretion system protein GspL [Hydrogenophaga sp.]
MLILTPSDFSVAPPAGPTALLDWATSANDLQVLDHGQCAASLLPRDDDVVLVLPTRAVSWHRLAIPKVAGARLRAVLDGLLEDRVLSDTAELHYALEPGGRSGQTVWVAACDKAWLRGWLQALEAAGRPVTRIVPSLWPLPATEIDQPGTALHWAHDESGQAWLASASALGVSCTPLPPAEGHSSFGELTAGLSMAAPDADPDFSRWLADPAVASQAERALNRRFELVPRPDWLLQCARSDWNLAQFDLSLSTGARRGQRLRQSLRRWRSAPAWRPARWGFVALVAVQLVGLNAAAWSERSALQAKQGALRSTLQNTFPQVSLVLDAPVQMQRELGRLQQASGALSARDLETLLAALAQVAPPNLPPPPVLVYADGELRLSEWATDEQTLSELALALERNGWRTRLDGTELSLQAAR